MYYVYTKVHICPVQPFSAIRFPKTVSQLSNISCSILTGDDSRNSYSVYAKEVDVIASAASGSSHPQSSNKVNYIPGFYFQGLCILKDKLIYSIVTMPMGNEKSINIPRQPCNL